MAERQRRAAIGASSVTALLLPLLAGLPAATDDPMAVTAPAPTAAAVGTPTSVPGASIRGLDASEVVRVLVGVGSGTVAVPATSGGVSVPAGYPALGADGPELALEGTQDALNAALAQLHWTPAAPGPAAITIDASPAGAAYDPANGHFYQVVSPPAGVHWDQAQQAASTATFYDQAGYLATITDGREQALLTTVTPGPAWIGGQRQPNRTWAWATGPEAGATFWTPDCGAGQQGPCSANNGATFAMWAPSEPRSLPGAGFTEFLGGMGGGQWAPSTNAATPDSYVVEFGGSPGDQPVEIAHADATVTASGGIAPITPAPGATPIRSTPPTVPTTATTEPSTTAAPDTTPPVATPAAPDTTVPPETVPTRTVPVGTVPATTPETAPVVTPAPADSTIAPAASADTAATTTIAPTLAAGSTDGVPVYIVFDVGVGTPLADVRITVRGERLTPESVVTAVAHSTPEVLAVATTDDRGNVVAHLTLPADLADGEHTIVVGAIAAGGSIVERQAAFALQKGILTRIGPPSATATTSPPTTVGMTAVATPAPAKNESSESSGGGLPVPLIVALLAAMVGAIVWLVKRRRQAAPAGRPSANGAPTGGDRDRNGAAVGRRDRVDQLR